MKEIQTIRAPARTFNEELLQDFISYLDTGPRTVTEYFRNTKRFIDYCRANGIRNPERKDIISYRESLKQRRLKPATVQAYIVALRQFFKWSNQAGLYPNICENVKGAKINPYNKKGSLTPEQASDLLNYPDKETEKGIRDYLIMLLMITGGLRDIEISRLDISDITSTNGKTILLLQPLSKMAKA